MKVVNNLMYIKNMMKYLKIMKKYSMLQNLRTHILKNMIKAQLVANLGFTHNFSEQKDLILMGFINTILLYKHNDLFAL